MDYRQSNLQRLFTWSSCSFHIFAFSNCSLFKLLLFILKCNLPYFIPFGLVLPNTNISMTNKKSAWWASIVGAYIDTLQNLWDEVTFSNMSYIMNYKIISSICLVVICNIWFRIFEHSEFSHKRFESWMFFHAIYDDLKWFKVDMFVYLYKQEVGLLIIYRFLTIIS